MEDRIKKLREALEHIYLNPLDPVWDIAKEALDADDLLKND